ncbi:amino acid ABC transporter permease [Vibrio ostreicida]|uniref:amino acid ABC transporter permease n=1 Tax=Vibrio ostreicida TaxID=526588 RepID=UPI000970ABCB|nr:amino acid ABC transporter permease [Vibrio ostreicida]
MDRETTLPRPTASVKRWSLNSLDIILLALGALVLVWLYQRASIGVQYQWQWNEVFALLLNRRADGSMPYIFQGVFSTLRLSLWGLAIAVVFGTLLGIARQSQCSIFRATATLYVQLIRNIPPLVFVFIFYFFISNQLIPLLGLDAILRHNSNESNTIAHFLFGPSFLRENLLSGVLCVGLLSAAYIAEIVRSGIANIPKGQYEAAHSLGLSKWVKYRDIIAPQVLASITPAIAGQAISLVKDTAIVSLISIQELTFVGSEIANSSGLIFEVWIVIGAAYLLFCSTLSFLFRRLETRALKHQKIDSIR